MRSPSELPLLRILHIKTLSAALSMLHSINYGTLSSCGSNVWYIAYSKRKWLQRQRAGWGVTGDRQCRDSPGSAKRHPLAPTHPPAHSTGDGEAARASRTRGSGSGAAVSDQVGSWTPWPGCPMESKAGLTLPPGHQHHHKVLTWETGQAMKYHSPLPHNANTTAPLPCGMGALGREGSGHRATRGQQQAKGHPPPIPRDTGHPHPTKGLSCLCLRGDSKVSLIKTSGNFTIPLFTSRHRPGLQARHLHKAQTNKGDSGRYSSL